MKIGTLIIEVYGELLEKQSIELFQKLMYQPLISVSDKFDFDYKRFEYLAARIIFVVPLKILWKTDHILNILRSGLDKNFANWTFDISLLLHVRQS